MKVYSPSELAKILEIKPATLRKYSIMLENKGYKIERNSQNHRFYRDDDVITMRRLITGSNSGVTLEQSVNNVISLSDDNTYTNETNNDVKAYGGDISELKGMIEKQGEQIAMQGEQIELQTRFIKELTERIDQQQQEHKQLLLDQQEQTKKGIFSRLFNK